MAADGWSFSPEELEVADIFLQLPSLIAKSEYFCGLSPAWGLKRKRSILNSSSPPSKEELKELSPTTPLSFSPTESDENIKHSKKKEKKKKKKSSLKKNRKELSKTVDELTERKKLLQGELENVRRYYDKLKAINSDLRSKKEQMTQQLKIDSIQLQPEDKISSPVKENSQSALKSSIPELQEHHQCPSTEDQTASSLAGPSQSYQYQQLGKVPSYGNIEPIGIPDLNVSFEELTHRSYSRLMAAQARQRRIQICKTKNMNAASKLQSPNPCR